MGYIKSSDIRIFPTSNRTESKQMGTNWLTEYNIASIVNQLTGCNGFVTYPTYGNNVDVRDSNSVIKFNMYGYYFETTVGAINKAVSNENTENATDYIYFNEDDKGNIEATINLSPDPTVPSSSTNDKSYTYLEGSDKVSSVDGGGAIKGKLGLILYNKTTGGIPQESRLNIAGFSRLDDGVLG